MSRQRQWQSHIAQLLQTKRQRFTDMPSLQMLFTRRFGGMRATDAGRPRGRTCAPQNSSMQFCMRDLWCSVDWYRQLCSACQSNYRQQIDVCGCECGWVWVCVGQALWHLICIRPPRYALIIACASLNAQVAHTQRLPRHMNVAEIIKVHKIANCERLRAPNIHIYSLSWANNMQAHIHTYTYTHTHTHNILSCVLAHK